MKPYWIKLIALLAAAVCLLASCRLQPPADTPTDPTAPPTDPTTAAQDVPVWDGRPDGIFVRTAEGELPLTFCITPSKDGYLGMFIHQYVDEINGQLYQMYGAAMIGEAAENDTATFSCMPEFFRITAPDADRILIEGTNDGNPHPFSGEFLRANEIPFDYPYSEPEAPAFEADAHCAVEMDATLAAGIRAQLGLPDDAMLESAVLEQVTQLNIFDIPVTSLKGISALRDLRQLSISSGAITDISELAGLTMLEMIDISWCYITEIPDLSPCVRLRELRLCANLITDLSPLNKLPWLQYAYFGSNRITSLAPIAQNDVLLSLGLDGNCILDYACIAENGTLQAAITAGSPFSYEAALDTEKLAKEIAATVTAGLSDDLSKEAALHRYMIENTEFETGSYRESAFGERALKTHKGVCGNYAEAFALLCGHAGIEAFVCTSDDHAWNIVKIDGQYYHCDSLWDENDADWDYFNRGTGYIMNAGSHTHDLLRYPSGLRDMSPLVVYAVRNGIEL